MTGIGAAMAGGNGRARQLNDWYPTPPEATLALLQSVWRPIDWKHAEGRPPIWEPAAGDGAMSRVLQAAGYAVISTDIAPQTAEVQPLDFLSTRRALAPALITNPPFKQALAEAFIRHAHALKIAYVALLLKAQYWHTAGRLKLWRDHRPAAVLPLTWRLDFLDLGAPAMDFSWVVWDMARSPLGTTQFLPLAKPRSDTSLDLFTSAPALDAPAAAPVPP